MNKRFPLLSSVILAFLLSLLSCHRQSAKLPPESGRQPEAGQQTPSTIISPPPRPPSLADDAVAQAKKHFDTIWQRREDSAFCQEDVVGLFDEVILEAKNVGFEPWVAPLSEADKLNGLEWRGEVTITAKVFRELNLSKSHLGLWRDGFRDVYRLERRNGSWKVTRTPQLKKSRPVEQLPK